MKESIKSFFRTNILTRGIYSRLAERRHNKLKEQKRKMIAMHGVSLIHYLQVLLQNSKIKFFFDMGTLLGIIRNGSLLKHDLDVDIAVYADSEEQKLAIRKMLIANGSKIQYSYSVDGLGTVEESYVHDGIKFDISYYTRSCDVDICYLFYLEPNRVYESADVMSVVRLECSTIEDIVQIDFNGVSINVPSNSEKYLEQRYGSTWRIPDTNYVYWKGPSTHPIEAIGRRTVYK